MIQMPPAYIAATKGNHAGLRGHRVDTSVRVGRVDSDRVKVPTA